MSGLVYGEDAQAGVDFAHAGEGEDNAQPFPIVEGNPRAEAGAPLAQVNDGAIIKGGFVAGDVVRAENQAEERLWAQRCLEPEVTPPLDGIDRGRRKMYSAWTSVPVARRRACRRTIGRRMAMVLGPTSSTRVARHSTWLPTETSNRRGTPGTRPQALKRSLRAGCEAPIGRLPGHDREHP